MLSEDKAVGKVLPLHQEEVAFQKKQSGDLDLRTAGAMETQATSLAALKRWPEAVQTWRDCLAIRQSRAEPRLIAMTQVRLGLALSENRLSEEAEPLLLQGCQALQPLLADAGQRANIRSTYREGAETLSKLLQAKGKEDDAKRWKKEADAAEK